MRFYEFTYRLKPQPEQARTLITEWFGSERDAVVRRLELFKAGKLDGKKKDHEIWPVDIPTDKQGLLAWLRANQK